MSFDAFMALCMALPLLISAPLFLWVYNLEVKVAELREEELDKALKSILIFGYGCLIVGLGLAVVFLFLAFG